MNAHFRRQAEYDLSIPERGYARLDHLVLPGGQSTQALLAFDLVDANWLAAEALVDPRFALDDLGALTKAWQKWAAQRTPGQRSDNPFERAPLYRLEVDLPARASWFGFPRLPDPRDDAAFRVALGVLEAQWFEFKLSPSRFRRSATATLYPGLFSNPVKVYAAGTMPTSQRGKALSGVFSLAHLPALSTTGFAHLISTAKADYLAAYDVGQGNANALVGPRAMGPGDVPWLYFDLGAGVYRNRHTTPPNLVFCFSENPPIVLSHWDADHWAGAYAATGGGGYPAHPRTWVAPLQHVGPLHVAFAHDVVSSGGTFYTYSVPAGTLCHSMLAGGQRVAFTLGTGSDRNGTGIVLAVEHPAHALSPRSWLLTGDCDYVHFMGSMAPLPPVGVVAPHHGASLSPSSPVPAPVPTGAYRRLVYSFGAGNKHGATKVQHPTSSGVTIHDGAGWHHGAWALASPGNPTPGPDVLATCEHPPGAFRGGALVGWDAPPAITGAPCGASSCTTTPTQA
jgi:hypothetical protein